ncbi:hypothetical protein ACS0TY_004946 [Phlomoides rotata]
MSAEKAINGVGVEMQKANSSSVCKCIPYKRSIEDQFGSLNLICVWKISKGINIRSVLYPARRPTNLVWTQSHRPLAGCPIKARVNSVWTGPLRNYLHHGDSNLRPLGISPLGNRPLPPGQPLGVIISEIYLRFDLCFLELSWISIDTHGEEEEGEEKEINGVGVEMQKANPSIVCKCIPYKRSIEDQFGSLNPTCVWKISEELSETYAIDVGRKKMQLSSWEAAIEFHTRKRDIFTDIPIPQDKDRW